MATVTITVTNSAPQADDDYYEIFPLEPDDPVTLFVLDNDSDPDSDPIRITDVSATAEGGEAWTDGNVIYYRLPQFTPTEMNIGGVVRFEDPPTSTDPPGDDGGEWAPFEDSFTYTVSDNVGATDTAFVQLILRQGQWEASLLPNFNEADEVGINGEPGYNLNIRQTFGRAQGGLRAFPQTQTWQKNVQNITFIFTDQNGTAKQEVGKSRLLADTNDITANAPTPLVITDSLTFLPDENVDRVALMLETVDKKLGFNKRDGNLGITLPTPNQQPWLVTKQEHKDLLDEMNPLFGTLSKKTTYVFLDQPFLEQLKNEGKIGNDVYNAIRATLQNDFGVDYDAVTDKYEKYTIQGLGSWEFPE